MNECSKDTFEVGETVFSAGSLSLSCDTKSGVWSLSSVKDGTVSPRIVCAHTAFEWNGMIVSSDRFDIHKVEQIADTVTLTHCGHPSFNGTVTQSFELHEDYLTTVVYLEGDVRSVCRVAPLMVSDGGLGAEKSTVFLAPADDTSVSRPSRTDELEGSFVGREAAAVWNDDGCGVAIASLGEDTKRTVFRLDAFGGTPRGFIVLCPTDFSSFTDHAPNGRSRICSERVYLGAFSDWRYGLLSYSDVLHPRNSTTGCGTALPPFLREQLGELWGSISVTGDTSVAAAAEPDAHELLTRQTNTFWRERSPRPIRLWREGEAETSARFRMTAALLSGRGLLLTDELSDLTEDSPKYERILGLLGNPDVAYAAELGRCFVPNEPSSVALHTNVYSLRTDDALYLAVFNNDKSAITFECELSRQLPEGSVYNAMELWSVTEAIMEGTSLTYLLGAGEVALFRIAPIAGNVRTLNEVPTDPAAKTDLRSLLVCGAASLGILAAAAVLYGKRKNDPGKKE